MTYEDADGFIQSQLIADIINGLFNDCCTMDEVDRLEVLDSINECLESAQLPLLTCGTCSPWDEFEIRV